MKISAVIPAYNVEKYIKRSIESVLGQKFKPVEIIVVDDGSTDGTANAVHEYGNSVRYLYQQNSGTSAARNSGIQAATGDWIAFLDADDEWLPHHLENAAKIVRSYPDLQWYGAAVDQYINDTGELIYKYKEKKSGLMVDNAYFSDYMIAFPPYAHFASPTMVIRKSVFEEVGLFDKEKKIGEDLDMWFRISLKYPNVGYNHTSGAKVYKRKTSTSYTKKINFKRDLELLKEKDQLAKQSGTETVMRAEPRIIFWCIRLLRASISRSDTEAVRAIMNTYRSRLPLPWRSLALLFLAMPQCFRPVFFLRNLLSHRVRAFKRAQLQ